jgi:adenine-specific DNA-methyltransferase
VVWRTSDNSNNNVTKFSLDHNDVLVYAKNQTWQPAFLDAPEKRSHFKNPDHDPRGAWFDGNPVNNPGLRPNLQFNVTAPNGNIIKHPPNGWRWSWDTIQEKMRIGEIRFSDDNTRLIRRTYLADMEGLPPSSLWVDLEETGHNRQAKYELKNLSPEMAVTDLFTTPKPEKLIQKILLLSSNENDLILDSFLGSGTTAAVAHKMNRRYIGIEMGEHAVTHCIPRLQKVIEGEQGGISKAVSWQGGGGFSFFTLGAPVFDAEGHITPEVHFNDLAAYIWWLETKSATGAKPAKNTPFIGELDGVAYYLLYNGILGDRRPNGGNVLTSSVLEHLLESHPHAGKKVIFGEASRLGAARLLDNHIEFKQIPYELHDRV